MAELSAMELEGRLHGQRQVLAVILAHLMARPGDDFRARISAQQVVSDHQEDPGAVTDPAFAYQAAAAEEIRLLMQRAEEMLKAG